MADSERDALRDAVNEGWHGMDDSWHDYDEIFAALAARGWRLVPSARPVTLADSEPDHDDAEEWFGAAQPSTEPLALREALRPIVADWFDTGYENGKLDSDVLTDRVLAALASPAAAPVDVDPDPMIGVRIAKCPHCGEELSVWPLAEPAPEGGEGTA